MNSSKILLVESFKLVPRPLDEGPRPKSGKLRLTYVAPVLEGKSTGSDQKTVLIKGELLIRLGTKVQSNSRIQFASNQSKLVLRKFDLGPTSKLGLMLAKPMALTLTLHIKICLIHIEDQNFNRLSNCVR
jgi:hypothetical protein